MLCSLIRSWVGAILPQSGGTLATGSCSNTKYFSMARFSSRLFVVVMECRKQAHFARCVVVQWCGPVRLGISNDWSPFGAVKQRHHVLIKGHRATPRTSLQSATRRERSSIPWAETNDAGKSSFETKERLPFLRPRQIVVAFGLDQLIDLERESCRVLGY